MNKLSDELKQLDAAKLSERIEELRVQLAEQKRARAAGELANPMAVRKTRRMIAVGLTLQRNPAVEPAKEETK